MIALALLFFLHDRIALQGEDWTPLWRELSRLRDDFSDRRAGVATKLSPQEAELARARLAEAAGARSGDPRAELLRAELELLAGRDVAVAGARLAARHPDPFVPFEHWFVADLLPPGLERARLVLAAMQDPAPMARWQSVLAYNAGLDAARAQHHADVVLPIQTRLHEENRKPWSASDLAITYRLLGDRAASDRVLAQTIERERAAGNKAPGLWEERGITALAFGDEVRARDYLGMALAMGSDNPGLLLARLDQMAGQTDRARRGFRGLILNRPPPDWAWRGWGTTLLPLPFGPAAMKPPLPNP